MADPLGDNNAVGVQSTPAPDQVGYDDDASSMPPAELTAEDIFPKQYPDDDQRDARKSRESKLQQQLQERDDRLAENAQQLEEERAARNYFQQQASNTPQQQPQQQQSQEPPQYLGGDQTDFASREEVNRLAYMLQQQQQVQLQQQVAPLAQTTQKIQQNIQAKNLREAEERGRGKYTDFDNVAQQAINLASTQTPEAQALRQLITTMPNSEDIAYSVGMGILGRNDPQLASRQTPRNTNGNAGRMIRNASHQPTLHGAGVRSGGSSQPNTLQMLSELSQEEFDKVSEDDIKRAMQDSHDVMPY